MPYKRGQVNSIEVRANLAVNVPGLPRAGDPYHLYVVYTDHQGREYFLRGGPENSVPTPANKPWGNIETINGRYHYGTIDWNPDAKRVQVYKGTDAGQKFQQLKRQFDLIEKAGIRYKPLEQNCNACVATALYNVGLPIKFPKGIWIPGAEVNQLIDRQGHAFFFRRAETNVTTDQIASVDTDLAKAQFTPGHDSTLTSLEKLNQAIANLQSPPQGVESLQQPASSSTLKESLAALERAIVNLKQNQQVPQVSDQEKQLAIPQRDQMELA